ncbi:MAG: hypothetical protein GSR85_07735 [Desulfurococcales archaeon]|nr:hypothetical protein [Desulfurococcales archaeon]
MASRRSTYLEGQASFRVLIVGESGKGKTRLTSRIAMALARVTGPGKVTALDFAPHYKGVGMPLTVDRSLIRIIRPEGLKAPRLMSGDDCSVAWRLAKENSTLTTEALKAFIDEPTPILVINDASIHLHAGDPGLLYAAIEEAVIFVGNSYLGSSLRDQCGIWDVEASRVKELMERMDIVWRL